MSARPEADEANYLERRTVRTVDARPMRTSRLFDALPPYPGGKRRLVPLILADLAAELPPAEWPGASFCDPMCGGGAVALAAKAQGFEVYASDRARRGAIVAAALIANSSVRLREADWLPALRPDYLRANGAAAGQVFTPAQARRIDGLLTAAAARQAPTRALLELLAIKLVCRLFPMSLPNATDAACAAAGEYDTISPRRLGHYLRRVDDRLDAADRVVGRHQRVRRDREQHVRLTLGVTAHGAASRLDPRRRPYPTGPPPLFQHPVSTIAHDPDQVIGPRPAHIPIPCTARYALPRSAGTWTSRTGWMHPIWPSLPSERSGT